MDSDDDIQSIVFPSTTVTSPPPLNDLQAQWLTLHPPLLKSSSSHNCVISECRLTEIRIAFKYTDAIWKDVYVCESSGHLHRCSSAHVCLSARLCTRRHEMLCPLTGVCFNVPEVRLDGLSECKQTSRQEWLRFVANEQRLSGRKPLPYDGSIAILTTRLTPIFYQWFDPAYINAQHNQSLIVLWKFLTHIINNRDWNSFIHADIDNVFDLRVQIFNISQYNSPVSPYVDNIDPDLHEKLARWYAKRVLALWNLIHVNTNYVLMRLLTNCISPIISGDRFLRVLPMAPTITTAPSQKGSQTNKIEDRIKESLLLVAKTHDLQIDNYMKLDHLLYNTAAAAAAAEKVASAKSKNI